MDSYIFNDVETEEEEKMRAFSDESGYLSESELLVDDSFWRDSEVTKKYLIQKPENLTKYLNLI